MAHRILTCKNHPELRWSCKEQAWTGGYNGTRNLFFNGVISERGMYEDKSGMDCNMQNAAGGFIHECECPTSDLILAPEDKLVMVQERDKDGKWITVPNSWYK